MALYRNEISPKSSGGRDRTEVVRFATTSGRYWRPLSVLLSGSARESSAALELVKTVCQPIFDGTYQLLASCALAANYSRQTCSGGRWLESGHIVVEARARIGVMQRREWNKKPLLRSKKQSMIRSVDLLIASLLLPAAQYRGVVRTSLISTGTLTRSRSIDL